MSVSLKYNFRVDLDETPDLALDLVTNPTIEHRIAAASGTLDATSTVPLTKGWSDQRQLSTGTDTIDLAALVRANMPNVDMSGLKIQMVKIVAATANTAGIVFADGSSNGYNIFGDGSGQVTVLAGMQLVWFGNDKLDDVGGSDKVIDVTSSDADAIYEIIIAGG